MTTEEELKPESHGRIHRILHYQVKIQAPPSKRSLPAGVLAEVERDWEDFPNLPGQHLSWRKTSRRCWELTSDSNGAVRVRREDKFRMRSAVFLSPPSGTYTSQGRTYEWQWVGRRKVQAASRVGDLVNTATNAPVLRMTGVHFNGDDATSVNLAGKGEIRFPVRGHKKCALMSATDESGNSLVEYRTVRGTNNLAVEAVISPNALTVPQVDLLIAVSTRFVFSYFIHPGSGG
jgi:hypothetical protein